MHPTYDLDKIKFATDKPTFERAVGLYESGKITKFKKLCGQSTPLDSKHLTGSTCFGWEEPLVKIFDECEE